MKRRFASPVSPSLFRRFSAGLMMVALLVLSFVPAGFMPSFAPDGKVAIVICSGVDTKTILVDADMAPPGSAHETGGQSCPYFLAQAGADVPPLSILPVSSFPLAAAMLPADDRFLPFSHALQPPARGPPAVTVL